MTDPVSLRSIKKSYQGEPVLAVDDLSLGRGEVLAVFGPNGAGKSTLLRIIGLLEPADVGGELTLFGSEPIRRHHKQLRRRIVVVFQSSYMFRRSVRENIAVGLRWRKLGPTEINKRIAQTAALLEIDFLDRSARTLSRGQAQRVALARALVLQPDVLLLDEPLSALDVTIRAKLLTDLKRILTAHGRSAIYVTHDVVEAALISDRSVTLEHGKIIPVITSE